MDSYKRKIQLPHWFVKIFGGEYYERSTDNLYYYTGEVNMFITSIKYKIKRRIALTGMSFAIWLAKLANKIFDYFYK